MSNVVLNYLSDVAKHVWKLKRVHTRASKLYKNNLLLRAGGFTGYGKAGRGEAANYLYNVTIAVSLIKYTMINSRNVIS